MLLEVLGPEIVSPVVVWYCASFLSVEVFTLLGYFSFELGWDRDRSRLHRNLALATIVSSCISFPKYCSRIRAAGLISAVIVSTTISSYVHILICELVTLYAISHVVAPPAHYLYTVMVFSIIWTSEIFSLIKGYEAILIAVAAWALGGIKYVDSLCVLQVKSTLLDTSNIEAPGGSYINSFLKPRDFSSEKPSATFDVVVLGSNLCALTHAAILSLSVERWTW